jgi:hypothetical protein
MLLPTILPVLNDFWNKPGSVAGMTQMDCLEKDGLGHPFLYPGKDGQISCSCNICTSTIRGGRIPQGARKAVRLFSNLVTEKYQLKMVYCCHAGFVYA